MTGYKIAFFGLMTIVYVAMLWIAPIWLEGDVIYIVKVLAVHGGWCLILGFAYIVGFLSDKAGF